MFCYFGAVCILALDDSPNCSPRRYRWSNPRLGRSLKIFCRLLDTGSNDHSCNEWNMEINWCESVNCQNYTCVPHRDCRGSLLRYLAGIRVSRGHSQTLSISSERISERPAGGYKFDREWQKQFFVGSIFPKRLVVLFPGRFRCEDSIP